MRYIFIFFFFCPMIFFISCKTKESSVQTSIQTDSVKKDFQLTQATPSPMHCTASARLLSIDSFSSFFFTRIIILDVIARGAGFNGTMGAGDTLNANIRSILLADPFVLKRLKNGTPFFADMEERLMQGTEAKNSLVINSIVLP